MPIILLWNAAAAPFGPQLGRWLNEMARSTLLLGKWLEKRLVEAQRLDRMSARFPVFRFYNTALTARIASVQLGSLLTQPVAGVGEHVKRAAEQWAWGRDIRAQRRSAELPAETLRVLEEMTGGIVGSLERFERPTPAMFDPRARTGSDLFGLAALAFRTIGAHRDGLYDAALRLRLALPAQRPARRRGRAGAGAEAGAEPPVLPLAFRLDELVRYVTAAILVIPALSELVRRIGGDALVALRYQVLDKLEQVERLAHQHRRWLLLGLRSGVSALAEALLQFLARISGFATGTIRRFTDIGVAYLRGIVGGVGRFADQLGTFWKGVRTLIDQMVAFGTAVTAIDVGDVVRKALVAVEDAIDLIGFHFYSITESPEKYEAPAAFPVTIGEIVLEEGAGARTNQEIRTALRQLVAAYRGGSGTTKVGALVYWLSDNKVHLGNIITSLGMIPAALELPRPGRNAQPVLTVDTSGAPDLVRKVIQPLRTGLGRAVGTIGSGVERNVGDIFTAAGATLSGTAKTFSQAATRAAGSAPAALVRRLVGDTDALMRQLFGSQAQPGRATGLEPVAGAFEAWLVQGGFDTIGSATAGYIRFVLDQWLVHLAEGRDTSVPVTPTSPRRLLERAELGRVHVPEIRIVARRNRLGRPLADRLAGEFHGAVQNAYRTGLGRMGQLLAAAAP